MEPAFPSAPGGTAESGMSLRDYFAAKAIPVAMRQAESACGVERDVRWNTARIAYEVADAMIAVREKGK